jgi:inorganic phosphate transporter, PiT family
VDAGAVVVVGLALAFAFTNGFHDASNAIATLVATRAARPGPAVLLAAAGNLIGPLVLGSAVANTIAGIADIEPDDTVEVSIAALLAAVGWNLLTWYRGLPSSSSHALVGGLVGAAVAAAGFDAVNWGGFDGWRPSGVIGVLVALAVSPFLGAAAAFGVLRLLRAGLHRATRRFRGPLLDAQWVTSGALALSHGANDAQKAVGMVSAVLLAEGVSSSLEAPVWVIVSSALALTLGTALGGWRVARTIGRRIYDIRPLDGLASQAGSAAVILSASLAGAPVSTTHVVASSVIGTGGGRGKWKRVRWAIVREMGVAWVTTLPATAAIAAGVLAAWRMLS